MYVTISLDDFEDDFVDADAAALGMTREEYLHDLVVEALKEEVAFFAVEDSQWKSH